jgi:hypothetical protein
MDTFSFSLRPLLPGYALAILAILLGFGLGVAFGANEDGLKAGLAAKAQSASHLYADEAAMKKVLDKSWVYFQRAHLHAGSLGTAAIAMITLLGFLGLPSRIATPLSIALGLGSVGYGLFWLLAGMAAPSLGSTGAAKSAYEWLGAGSPGILVISTLVVFAITVKRMLQR